MKKHVFFAALFITIILLSNRSFAQDSTLIKLDKHFALQFQLGDNFKLTNFNGYTFSGKYHLSKFAIRVGAEVGSFNRQNNRTAFNADTLLSNNTFEYHSINIRINLQGLYYLSVYKDIAAYVGGGPFFAFNKLNKAVFYNPNTLDKTTEKENATEIGLTALIGVEWFVKENIGLSAEYGIDFSNFHSTSDSFSEQYNGENTFKTFRNSEFKIFQVYANSAKLGIVIYF